MPSVKQMLANAITGDQKQYLEDISVANIFPDNLNELKPDGIKKMRTMISDPGIGLILPTLFSKSQRTIKNQFVNFRKKFQVSSRLAEKNLLLAQKAEEADIEMPEKLSNLEEELGALEAKFGTTKREAEKLETEFFSKESSPKSQQSEELEKLKQSFREMKTIRAKKINAKKSDVEEEIKAAENKQKQTAKATLEAYAGKNKKKKEELLNGKYNWGPLTKKKEAVNAKQAYLLYHGKTDEWRKATFENELAFLEDSEKFSKGKFKTFHGELVAIDNQMKEMQAQMNELIKKIENKNTKKEKIHGKVQELERFKGEIFKYMNKKNEYESKVLRTGKALEQEKLKFESVKSDADRICGHVETFLEGYKPEPGLKKKIDTAKENGTISSDDSKGGAIPLILVVAKCYYFFNKLSDNCSKKIESLETKIIETQKKLSLNKLKK